MFTQAFFNIILRDLGVENVKAQELFTVEQEFMDLLPYANEHKNSQLSFYFV